MRPSLRAVIESSPLSTEFLGKTLSGPFTIPSGIVTTAVPIMQYIFDHMPEVGVITTKSIGPEPRLGYREPVLSQYAPGCFVNAVGLTNPGPEQSAQAMAELRVPEDRFLLTSIFGGSIAEFVEVAKIMAPVSDGLELNLSCPHAKGYGMAMGQDPEMVQAIVSAVKDVVDIPVIPKLTPNTPDIGLIARAAEAGGADGFCAINTVGPGYTSAHGHPVLSNGAGGMSGKGILPIGLKCVREVRAVSDLPIIGCGGVSSADDVRAFQDVGANVIGVGSALIGLTTDEIGDYFRTLAADLDSGRNRAETLVRYDVDMDFDPVTLVSNEKVCDDITILTFDRKINIQAGEFIFLWIPGVGEKPFSWWSSTWASSPTPAWNFPLAPSATCEDPTAFPWSRARTPASWRWPVAPAWLRCTRWPGTSATPRCSPGPGPPNVCTSLRSAGRLPTCT